MTVSKTSAIALAGLAASVVKTMENSHTEYMNQFVNWAALAGQMEVRDGSSKITQRMEYEITNQINQVWVALYGNTTDVSTIPAQDARIPSTLRFCARLNLAYWENQMSDYLVKHPEVDRASVEYNELVASNDLNWINIVVCKEESILNYNRLMAQFKGLKALYELITDAAYSYKPYAERGNTGVQHSVANINLAKQLLAG